MTNAPMDSPQDVELLEGLLTRYSPSNQEGEAAAYLVGQMIQLGFQAGLDSTGSVIGTLGGGPHEIILLGHIDTVPGFIPVQKKEGRMFGRGAVDAKGPLACFTAAAARVGPQPGWRLTVIGAVGEEADSRGARALINHPAPDMLIIGEPSGWNHITLGYKGSAWFHYTVRRTLAHTASRSESASEAAFAFWNSVVNWGPHHNSGQERVFFQLTPTLRGMNSSSDGFNETAGLRIGFRLPPGLEVDELENKLHELAENAEIERIDGIPAYRADKNTPLVRALLAAIREYEGNPSFTLKTGTSDMNIVAPVWNCPTAAYGPGDSSLDHTPEEHILISEYLKGIDVLTEALLTLTQPVPVAPSITPSTTLP